jgi:hypothetical protein
MAFDRGDRTYFVSDERLRAFRALPVAERLRWVEESALFLRLARGHPPTPRVPHPPGAEGAAAAVPGGPPGAGDPDAEGA